MSYAITARHWMGDKEYIEAVLDSAADLAALGDGYAPDSRAIVAEGGAAYMTDASGNWQELGSPGGGGGSAPVLETLTVTENDTYTPDAGVDGFDEVIVNVSGGGGSVLVASKIVGSGYVEYTFNTGVDKYAVGAIPAELHNLKIDISFNPSHPIVMDVAYADTLTVGSFIGNGYRFATDFVPFDRFPSAIYAVSIA